MSLSFPQYRSHSVNMPEVHRLYGQFSAIAVPLIVAGKGFVVARVGTGVWSITLNRNMPANHLLGVFCNTLVGAAVDEDIVVKARPISVSQINFITYTGATPTDPNSTTLICFHIDFMLVKLPVK